MNFMIVPGMLFCSSFLISVCMFIVSKALLISSATVIVHAGGVIWFSTVLFSVCSAVIYSMEVVHQKQQFLWVIKQFITNNEEFKEILVMCDSALSMF